MTERRLHVELPAEPESLDRVQDALARLWEESPSVSMVDRIRFETAVVEVVGNVVEHAYSLDTAHGHHPGRAFDVRVELGDERLRAQISDNGLPVALDLGAVTMPGEDAESGRGLALALATVDDLSYDRVEGRNVWVLLCRRGERDGEG